MLYNASVTCLDVLNDGVEAAMLVRGILHDPLRTVRFQEGVFSLNFVTIPRLPLALNIVRVKIVNGVVVMIVWMGLKKIVTAILCLKQTKNNIVLTW